MVSTRTVSAETFSVDTTSEDIWAAEQLGRAFLQRCGHAPGEMGLAPSVLRKGMRMANHASVAGSS